METKHAFLEFLKINFTENNQPIGKYCFVKWLKNGNFQYEILHLYRKSIKRELLILAFETYKQKPEIKINYKWLKSQGHNNWCTAYVLRTLFEMYDRRTNKK